MFHSLDKVTSTAIHILPTMLCYVKRWESSAMVQTSASLAWWQDVFQNPLCMYLGWQALYIFITEFANDIDHSVMTSLRWITRDRKNPMTRGVAGVCRKIGVFREDEFFDSETWKTKNHLLVVPIYLYRADDLACKISV